MLNWISSACILLAGQAGPLYVNTKISMHLANGTAVLKAFIQIFSVTAVSFQIDDVCIFIAF